MIITKIISGGQTGVDRAALDVAIELKISHGGWCPKGRRAELNTTIPSKYHLKETESEKFEERTKLNIKDSDGTLALVPKTPIKITDGTILTIEEAKLKNKPLLIINLSKKPPVEIILKWIGENNIKTLNIAGPRESQSTGIYDISFKFLYETIKKINNDLQIKNGCVFYKTKPISGGKFGGN
ncbi:MAG: putative molybdenum carrier protein [Gammaproteobacteria bacterium]|jgi:hypothetical protein